MSPLVEICSWEQEFVSLKRRNLQNSTEHGDIKFEKSKSNTKNKYKSSVIRLVASKRIQKEKLAPFTIKGQPELLL